MNKQTALIFSSNAFLSNSDKILDIFSKIPIVVISHDQAKLYRIANRYNNYANINICSRQNIRSVIERNEPQFNYIMIGTSTSDMRIAAPKKMVLINPKWISNIAPEVNKYGIPIYDIENLSNYVSIFERSANWFEEITVSQNAVVRALTSAKTYYSSYYKGEELDLINAFRALLKNGDNASAKNNISYFDVLYYYLSAMIAKDSNMHTIQDWAIFPSSGCNLNPEMNAFKERVRYLMNGRKSDNIFIRHTAIEKSHLLSYEDRLSCDRHLSSIHINPVYRGKLSGRIVCVLDDYLTNGTSFETARNLLQHENVKFIYFIALGSFEKKYIKQDYLLKGDLYSQKYAYEKLESNEIIPTINADATSMIRELNAIINK